MMRKTINIKLRTFVIVQVVIVSVLILAGLSSYLFSYVTGHEHLLGFSRLMDVGSEQSLATYFSVINMLLSSLLLFLIYLYEKETAGAGHNYWLFLALIFLLLSADESASIHENFSLINAYITKQGLMPSMPILGSHQWVVFGVLFVVIVLIIVIPFLKNLPKKTRNYFLIAGFVFVVGAIGFEFLGPVMLSTGIVESNKDILYQLRRIFEEGFEMYGIAIFNSALYREMINKKITFVMEGP